MTTANHQVQQQLNYDKLLGYIVTSAQRHERNPHSQAADDTGRTLRVCTKSHNLAVMAWPCLCIEKSSTIYAASVPVMANCLHKLATSASPYRTRLSGSSGHEALTRTLAADITPVAGKHAEMLSWRAWKN